MRCMIIETGECKGLSIIDPKTGMDYTRDMIGNAGDLDRFVWDDDSDAYRVSADVYDWWARVVREQQGLENRLYTLRQEHGDDAVQAVIDDMPNVDLEDHATVLNRMLDAAFVENDGDLD